MKGQDSVIFVFIFSFYGFWRSSGFERPVLALSGDKYKITAFQNPKNAEMKNTALILKKSSLSGKKF
ncbi:MAG: hypothetical protein QM426_02085 [Euryarchaeota archaeon]|nr:hypothetical protein [Euryarchaeota archaeon]